MEKIPVNQRAIILVPFPFSDQTGEKIRPALIVSNNRFNLSGEDIIVCGITSNIKPTDYSVIIEQKDLEDGILYKKSSIRVEGILKIEKSFIIKTIAKIDDAAFSKVKNKLSELLS